MKQFLSFVRKEFYHIFRDRRTMLILLAMPIIQILLFGFAITTEVRNVQVAVFDPSKDAAAERIVNQINASKYFKVEHILNNRNEIDAAFRKGAVNLVIVFGENFESNLLHTGEASLQLIADGTDPNQAATLVGYATNIIGSYQQELMREHKIPMQIIPEVKMLYNPEIKSAYNFVPGVMGMILMLICAMMTAISIVREKEMGTMEVLLASPMKPLYIILAKAVPYLTISMVNLVTILLISVYGLGVPVAGSLFWLMLISVIFIMVALALGLLISTIVDTQVAAMMASGMGLMMPVMLLSGMIFPVQNMPLVLNWISHLVPARWYIAAVKKQMIQGLGFSSVIEEFTILTIMAVVLIAISFKKFKTRLE